ncbi:TRAP transporter small permease [Moorella sp. ACPs]|uniref:TRAP transporter small permease n=1 Tax=Neomoorella carbonis TaxID=3062783 RepID=UPI003255809E
MGLKQISEKINQLLEVVCGVFLITLFVLLLVQVGNRLVKISSSWIDETIQFLLAWFVFLGSAVLVHKTDHISVDLLAEKLNGTGQKLLRYLVLVSILAVGGFMIYCGNNLILHTVGKKSPIFDLPLVFWYLSIPTSGVLIIFFALTKMIQRLK